MLNWISITRQYLKPFNCVPANEFWLVKNVTYKLFVYKSYIWYVCLNVTYWPSTEPSIKKQSKISPWPVDGLNSVQMRCPQEAGEHQTIIKNEVPQTAWVSWGQLVRISWSSRQWEPAPDRGLAAPCDPWLSSPAEWERSAAIVRNLGSICCSLFHL